MNSFISFLKLIRLPNLLIVAFTQYMVRYCILYPGLKGTEIMLGQYCMTLPAEGLKFLITDFDFFLLSLSTVLITAAGYIINDYFDVRIDRINKPDQMVIDKGIKRRVAMGAHVVINTIAFIIGSVLSWKYDFFYPGTFIFGICIILLWFYSTNLKRMFLVGNLAVAFLTGMVPLIVALFELKLQTQANGHCLTLAHATFWPLFLVILVFSAFAFVVTLLREIIKDIEDYEGDMENGCTTFAVTLGVNKSQKLVALLTVFVMALLAALEVKQLHGGDVKSFWYFTLGLQLPFLLLVLRLFTATEKKHFTLSGRLTKLIMLSGICYLFLYRTEQLQMILDATNMLKNAY
jgi:4-hydroxybenzoate polyprenyltransferase